MKTGRDAVIEALNLARMGEMARASRLLQEMRNQPDFEADACYGLGLLELCRNKLNNSAAYFEKATELDSTHADAYYQLAKIADTRGDPITAVLYLKLALTQKPGHALATEALAEHGAIMEARAQSAGFSDETQPAGPRGGQWRTVMSKSGLDWKTLVSMIMLVAFTIGAVQAT